MKTSLTTGGLSCFNRRGFLALAAGGLLAACTPAPSKNRPSAMLTFVAREPIILNVGRIDVREDWRSPGTAFHVEHLMPLSPVQAARRWSQERLRLTGRSGVSARLVILDASVVEKRLEVESGLSGAFQNEQSERFDAVLEVVLEIIDDTTQLTLAQASARVTRYATLREEASLNDRDTVWISLVEDLMIDFDKRMESAIRTYMTSFLG